MLKSRFAIWTVAVLQNWNFEFITACEIIFVFNCGPVIRKNM
jgi:hypothetical protein